MCAMCQRTQTWPYNCGKDMVGQIASYYKCNAIQIIFLESDAVWVTLPSYDFGVVGGGRLQR